MDASIGALIGLIQTESVDYLTAFINSYWAVMLTIGGVLLLGRWFLKLTNLGR